MNTTTALLPAPQDALPHTDPTDGWFDPNELVCELRGDVPWTDWRANPIVRCQGIGWQVDSNGEVLRVAVDDGREFLRCHGSPCTDKRAAALLDEHREFGEFAEAEAREVAEFVRNGGWN